MNEDVIIKKMQEGFNCAQIVFSNFSEELGVDEELAKKIASCFGGGTACTTTCGAVSGALMALGMKYGNYLPNPSLEIKSRMKEKVDEFNKLFIEEYDSTLCKEILGYDIKNPAELKIVQEKGIFTTTCAGAIAYAIEVLKELL